MKKGGATRVTPVAPPAGGAPPRPGMACDSLIIPVNTSHPLRSPSLVLSAFAGSSTSSLSTQTR